jgi:hypothetical protein
MSLLNTKLLAAACIAAAAGASHAASFVEDFEGAFPAWESGWFGVNTNVNNYICAARGCAARGNNPDGLWARAANGRVGDIPIDFLGGFGDSISSLSLDIAGYAPVDLRAWDKHGALIYSQAVTLTFGAFGDPGVYASYTIQSTNGISRFGLFATGRSQAAGNTSIDNIAVNVVPEPGTYALMALGLVAVATVVRRRR